MDLKEKLAKKMLVEELDFLPLAESVKLYESGVKVETHFWWVMNSEELEDNGEGKTIAELLKEYDEIYGLYSNCNLRKGNRTEEFDEFTLELCPAPTYIDLIK